MAFSVHRQLRVLKGEQAWVPTEEVTVDGKVYIKFFKWDSDLVYLMTGKKLYLAKEKRSSSGSLDCDLWQDLVKARQEAANDLLTKAKTVEHEGGPPKKKAKLQRATSKSMILLPETVEVSCREYKLRMLLRGLGSQVLWLEGTCENLQWFFDNVQSSRVKERKHKRKGSKNKGVERAAASDESEEASDDE
ncbi:unnamed protein product [Symbiodinium sp. CCMP2592]|nr:unnamed protein product [Symbiodinium sp. CCMP2592]